VLFGKWEPAGNIPVTFSAISTISLYIRCPVADGSTLDSPGLGIVNGASYNFGDIFGSCEDYGAGAVFHDDGAGIFKVEEEREGVEVLGRRARMGEVVHEQAWLEQAPFNYLFGSISGSLEARNGEISM
jgi:hypothetical protein